jgi:4-hydroxythreonine-4-phosphate dehydrogenase
MADSKPIIAVTLGDPAGSGPELITKAFAEPEVRAVCRPVVVGDAATVRAALAITRVPSSVRVISRLAETANTEAMSFVMGLPSYHITRNAGGTITAAAARTAGERRQEPDGVAKEIETASVVASGKN